MKVSCRQKLRILDLERNSKTTEVNMQRVMARRVTEESDPASLQLQVRSLDKFYVILLLLRVQGAQRQGDSSSFNLP